MLFLFVLINILKYLVKTWTFLVALNRSCFFSFFFLSLFVFHLVGLLFGVFGVVLVFCFVYFVFNTGKQLRVSHILGESILLLSNNSSPVPLSLLIGAHVIWQFAPHISLDKNLPRVQDVMEHAFNPRTWQAEADRSL